MRDYDLSLGQLHPVSMCNESVMVVLHSLVPVNDRLSAAKRIILVGHGPGVLGISELLEARSKHQSDFRVVRKA